MSPYIFQKLNKSNSISYRDDFVEKGETDSRRKENVLSGSEDEERYNNNSPPKEKRFKQDYHMNSCQNQRSIYTKTTEDKESGVKIVTSVSVSDMEDTFPKIMFQQIQEPLVENLTQSSTPVTNILKINCAGPHVNLEIQEILQLNASGINTSFVFMNQKGDGAETFAKNNCEKTWTPSNESPEQPSCKVTDGNQNTNYRFTFRRLSEQTGALSESKSTSWDSPACCQCCRDHKQQRQMNVIELNRPSSPPGLVNIQPQGKRKLLRHSFSSDQSWDIPPPQEFADTQQNSLEELTLDLASCRIGTCSLDDEHQGDFRSTPKIPPNEECVDLTHSFDYLSESDDYEPMFMRAAFSSNSNFTKDFVNCQKRKSWIRNNSIATVVHRSCSLPKKRRQTFPGVSEGDGLMQEDLLVPYSESFSSLIMCSLHLQTEMLEMSHECIERFGSSHIKGSLKDVSGTQNIRAGKQMLQSPLYMTDSDVFADNDQSQATKARCHHEDLQQRDKDIETSVSKDSGSSETDDCECRADLSKLADSGFDQEMKDVDYPEELSRCTIKVIPPSCSGSEEQILHPVILFQDMDENGNREDPVSVSPERRKSSIRTMTVGELGQRFIQTDSESSLGSSIDKYHEAASDDPYMSPSQRADAHSLISDEVFEEMDPKAFAEGTVCISYSLPLVTRGQGTEDSDKPAVTPSCPAQGSSSTEMHTREKAGRADKMNVSKCK